MSLPTVLRVEKLCKFFGKVAAVDHLSCEVHRGELLGIIGPNGSGKTTLVNLVSGFVKPTSGRILYNGQDITRTAPHKIVLMGISRTFQMVRPFYQLPAYKN